MSIYTNNERNCFSRRFRHTSLPHHQRSKQTTAARFRQANDLLPHLSADAGGDTQNTNHFYSHRFARLQRLLGDGSDFGIHFEYAEQPSPDGLAQAFIIGKEFIGNDSVCLVLGDNIFHGPGFTKMLKEAVRTAEEDRKATVFGYWVCDPERYGVAEFDPSGNVLQIEEKPKNPKSNYAVVGLYFYPHKVVKVAQSIQPSLRGELEITTVNQQFLDDKELKVQLLGRGFAWLDTGTHDSLSEAFHLHRSNREAPRFKNSLPGRDRFQTRLDRSRQTPRTGTPHAEKPIWAIFIKGYRRIRQGAMNAIETGIERLVIIESRLFKRKLGKS